MKYKHNKKGIVKVLGNVTVDDNWVHTVKIQADEYNDGIFGSKVHAEQIEKIESVLTKRYIKLPFGISVIL